MMRLKGMLAAAGLFALLTVTGVAQEWTTPTLHVAVDRALGIYDAGESVEFRVTLKGGVPAAGLTLDYLIAVDGTEVLTSGTTMLGAETVRLPAVLERAGHLQLVARAAWPGSQISGSAGALVDPEKIEPGLTEEPEDFDEFWQRQRETLGGRLAVTLDPVTLNTTDIQAWRVTVAMPEGNPLRGYLARPAGAQPGTLPAILYPHAAGVRASQLASAVEGARLGMLAFDFNAHGIADDMPEDFYAVMARELAGYQHRGKESRESWYMLGVYRRLLRALDFVAGRGEWDGRVLIVSGFSQGGAQAITASGLDPRVTAIVAAMPAMCDLGGCRAGRLAGWPQPVPVGRGGECLNEEILHATSYFDAVFFARRSQAEALFTVGLADRVCPPASVVAAYNQWPHERRQMIVRPGLGHAHPADFQQSVRSFILAHIARMRQDQEQE